MDELIFRESESNFLVFGEMNVAWVQYVLYCSVSLDARVRFAFSLEPQPGCKTAIQCCAGTPLYCTVVQAIPRDEIQRPQVYVLYVVV